MKPRRGSAAGWGRRLSAPSRSAPRRPRAQQGAACRSAASTVRRWRSCLRSSSGSCRDGRICGREYVARNPRRDDRRAGSFKINVTAGRWSDFATGDKGGDPISLAGSRSVGTDRNGRNSQQPRAIDAFRFQLAGRSSRNADPGCPLQCSDRSDRPQTVGRNRKNPAFPPLFRPFRPFRPLLPSPLTTAAIAARR